MLSVSIIIVCALRSYDYASLLFIFIIPKFSIIVNNIAPLKRQNTLLN